jgi:hypothetical protein
MISGWLPKSAWRPVHRPAAEDVRVDVADCLAGAGAGVEDDPVTLVGNALGDRHIVRVGNEIGKQVCFGGSELGQIRVMSAGDHKHVNRRLWVDITERHCARISRHYLRGYLSGSYAAEQAVGHGPILTCGRSGALLTYMVGLLRTHAAPPLWCNGLASFWPRRSGMSHARALRRRHGMWVWGEVRISRRTGRMSKAQPYL